MRYNNPTTLIRRMTRAARRPRFRGWTRDGFTEVMIFAIGGLAVSLLILAHAADADLARMFAP